jgi:hypothetical protein
LREHPDHIAGRDPTQTTVIELELEPAAFLRGFHHGSYRTIRHTLKVVRAARLFMQRDPLAMSRFEFHTSSDCRRSLSQQYGGRNKKEHSENSNKVHNVSPISSSEHLFAPQPL